MKPLPPDDSQKAKDVEALPVKWLWLDRIPEGMLSLIVGRPDQGKSLLSVFLTAEISRRGGDVIFSNLEDSPAHVLRPRLEAAGANLDRVHFWHPILPDNFDELRAMVIKTKAKLLILDPIAAHLRASIYNDQDVRTVLTPLTKLAADTGCAVVMIHHTVKKVGNHPLSAIGGSGGGLPGAARVIYVFGMHPDNEDERIMAPIKFNIGPPPKSVSFEIDGCEYTIKDAKGKETLISTGRLGMLDDDLKINPMKILLASSASVSAEKKAMAAEWITEYLADGPKPVGELQTAASLDKVSWRTLRRAADEIGVVKTRHGGGPGSYVSWELPPDHPAIAEA